MILVDTSIWIDHLHAADDQLSALLDEGIVGCHPAVIEELALGSIARRDDVLNSLSSLYQFPELDHTELMVVVDRRHLWGRDLSAVDAHLLGSVLLTGGARLWTRDKRLRAACRDADVAQVDAG